MLRGTPAPGTVVAGPAVVELPESTLLVPAPTEISGPCVVELPESTLLVPPGWSGEVDDSGTIHIRTEDRG